MAPYNSSVKQQEHVFFRPRGAWQPGSGQRVIPSTREMVVLWLLNAGYTVSRTVGYQEASSCRTVGKEVVTSVGSPWVDPAGVPVRNLEVRVPRGAQSISYTEYQRIHKTGIFEMPLGEVHESSAR